MTYTRQEDQVTLAMTVAEYDTVLLVFGFAMACAFQSGEKELGYSWLHFMNKLNADNPQWTPYAIPDFPEDKRVVQ